MSCLIEFSLFLFICLLNSCCIWFTLFSCVFNVFLCHWDCWVVCVCGVWCLSNLYFSNMTSQLQLRKWCKKFHKKLTATSWPHEPLLLCLLLSENKKNQFDTCIENAETNVFAYVLTWAKIPFSKRSFRTKSFNLSYYHRKGVLKSTCRPSCVSFSIQLWIFHQVYWSINVGVTTFTKAKKVIIM